MTICPSSLWQNGRGYVAWDSQAEYNRRKEAKDFWSRVLKEKYSEGGPLFKFFDHLAEFPEAFRYGKTESKSLSIPTNPTWRAGSFRVAPSSAGEAGSGSRLPESNQVPAAAKSTTLPTLSTRSAEGSPGLASRRRSRMLDSR